MSKTIINPFATEEDIKKIFADWNQQAEKLMPGMTEEIKAFNDNKAPFEIYTNYIAVKNQTPNTLTTNNTI